MVWPEPGKTPLYTPNNLREKPPLTVFKRDSKLSSREFKTPIEPAQQQAERAAAIAQLLSMMWTYRRD